MGGSKETEVDELHLDGMVYVPQGQVDLLGTRLKEGRKGGDGEGEESLLSMDLEGKEWAEI